MTRFLTGAPCALVLLFLAAALSSAAPAQARQEPGFQQFSAYDPNGTLRVSYQVWSNLLSDIVYDVGYSDRRPAGSTSIIRTGTRLSRTSTSRYRHEANRVIYHLIDDERAAAISEYRTELETLPATIDFASLSRDEQLAFWLNLHNVIVIDELIRRYPEQRLDRPVVSASDSFYNRDVATVAGLALSLNDIRFNIVEANWDDPRVIYGFFSGAVGGPTLQDSAFEGGRVWSQLDRSAREYVNSLRGVESNQDTLTVSRIFFEHRGFFPNWPTDLQNHLQTIAEPTVRGILATATAGPQEISYDWSIADLTNGQACGSTGTASPVESIGANGRSQFNGACAPLTPEATELIRAITIRRLEMLRSGNLGRVLIRDIPTTDTSEDEGSR